MTKFAPAFNKPTIFKSLFWILDKASKPKIDTSSESITLTKDLEISVEGKNVILVEDIIDTGLTVKFLYDYLKQFKPKNLKICALIDKKERRKVEIAVDYIGFEIEKGFLVGYGLDFAEKYRHLPEVYEVIRGD